MKEFAVKYDTNNIIKLCAIKLESHSEVQSTKKVRFAT